MLLVSMQQHVTTYAAFALCSALSDSLSAYRTHDCTAQRCALQYHSQCSAPVCLWYHLHTACDPSCHAAVQQARVWGCFALNGCVYLGRCAPGSGLQSHFNRHTTHFISCHSLLIQSSLICCRVWHWLHELCADPMCLMVVAMHHMSTNIMMQ